MALRTPDHDWNLAQLDLLSLELIKELTRLVLAVSLSLFNMDVDLAIDLICHVPDSCFMGEVRIHSIFVVISHFRIFHHGFGIGVNLTEFNHVADLVVLVIIDSSRDVLSVNFDHVVLMFVNTVCNHVLNETIEGLNLLVNDTILVKVSVDNLPLIIDTYVLFSVIFELVFSTNM